MRFCQRRRDRDGFLSIAPRLRVCSWALAGKITNNGPRFRTLCVSQGIIRIELDCTIEVSNGFAIILDVTTLPMEVGLEISIVCFHAVRGHLGRLFLRSEQ